MDASDFISVFTLLAQLKMENLHGCLTTYKRMHTGAAAMHLTHRMQAVIFSRCESVPTDLWGSGDVLLK